MDNKDDWLRESQISIKMEKIASEEEKDLRSSGKGRRKSSVKKSWGNFFNLDKIKKKILKKKDEVDEEEYKNEHQCYWCEELETESVVSLLHTEVGGYHKAKCFSATWSCENKYVYS